MEALRAEWNAVEERCHSLELQTLKKLDLLYQGIN
jgi:hypothetical protein